MDSIERCNKLFVANILQQIIMATVRRIGEKNDLTMKTMINSTESLKTIPTIPKDMVVKELINKFETFKLNNELLENVSNKGSDLKLLIEDLDREVRAILRQMVLRMVMDTVRTFEPRTRLHHGCTAAVRKVGHTQRFSIVTGPSNEEIPKIIEDPSIYFKKASLQVGIGISSDIPIDNVVPAHDRTLVNDKYMKLDNSCISGDVLRNNEELRSGEDCKQLENITVNYKRKEAIYRTDDDCSKDDCIAGDDDTADDNYIADDDYTEDNHYREDDDDYRADDDYRKDDEYRADDKVNGKHMKERFNTRLLKVFIGIFCCFSKSSKYR
ncbi:uncharacterized protein LOC127850789 isoform X1 [Dreissena polymorpha]|uniref:Uncharacterized protein n=1 Tax=Dreissena polymorpha TaxID=45954 RepID=A0A9D4CVX6_DREPO|nr:uncharacterized protein LOC127850789 isoform X1 [Dreissena polymorpha]KAH3734491.1 hypothetical protein DPMN_040930 [Dreissena polymorpha]